jgi:hypothetical protein
MKGVINKLSWDKLKFIEEELKIDLPDSYKKLLQWYPFEGLKYFNVKENLCNEPDLLVTINRHYREYGYQGKPLPEDAYIIGKNSDDSIFFINLSNANPETVYYLDEEKQYNPYNLEKYILSYNFKEFIELTKILQDVLHNPKHKIKKRSDWIISLRGLFSREQNVSYR